MHLKLFLVCSILSFATGNVFRNIERANIPGGLGPLQKFNPLIQNLINQVRLDAESEAGHKFDNYLAMSYKSQIVGGTNYFVKVQIGLEKYVHLKVFVPFPFAKLPPTLLRIQLNKKKDDPIEYF
ncbi:cystatin-B-like [Xenia sp. Carnegie-2017]|uniref:cystatin-B-like n=1 Tax=Xenia sp. Carnegie-2017 TaxID=2897299 RepID=UPI001F04C71D|nr:cystatin-B-like [Xenia sp. Carnegie-2017]